jgi:hypothetical protein
VIAYTVTVCHRSDHPVKVEPVQQWLEGGDLVGRAGDLTLGRNLAIGVLSRAGP